MIDEDLDEDVDETIQHYARKKREGTNTRLFIISVVVIVVLGIVAYFLFLK